MSQPSSPYEAISRRDGSARATPMTDEEVALAAYKAFDGTVSMDEIRRAIKDMIRIYAAQAS